MGVTTRLHDMALGTAPKRLVLAASVAVLFCGVSAPARAVDMEDLVEKLREKGVLSEEEYQEMRTDVRAEKRKAALERAVEEEHAAKKKESAATELTGRFKEGFTWESGDKQNSISVSGRVHADFRSFSEDSTNANSADTFDVRRAYLGISGKLYGDWGYTVNADFGSLGADLDVAHVDYNGLPVKIRAGQFKMPFSLEELTSSRFLDFQERGFANALVPGKERGLMFHGEVVKGLVYAVAASNGAGKNANETNAVVDDKDLIGRVAVNFAEFTGSKDAVMHLGGAFTTGTIPVAAAPSGRTEGRGLTFFTPAAFTGAETDRERTGAELALAWNQIKLQSEWINANYSGTSAGGDSYDRDISSYYAGISWLITGEKYADSYKGGTFGAIKPNRAFRKGGEGWGAWEVGVRYSVWDAGDFATTNAAGTGLPTAGTTSEAEAITVGLKWIPNTNTRVYLNYVQTDFDTPVAVAGGGTTNDEKAVTMRAAVYF
jgi:phosphate-selective porin OprO and OprP